MAWEWIVWVPHFLRLKQTPFETEHISSAIYLSGGGLSDGENLPLGKLTDVVIFVPKKVVAEGP